MHADSTNAIIRAILAGNSSRFGELVERFDEPVRRVAGTVRDPVAREDVVHETFCFAFRHLGSLAAPEKFGSWVQQIARRRVSEHFRRKADAPEAREQPAAPDAPDTEWIWDEVGRLDPAHAEVIRMRYREGLSNQDVARRLGVPRSTVRGRVFEARKALRRRLDARGLEP